MMEATSDYWKPFFYLLEETLPVVLVNAKAARNIPGRKTDVSDAAWPAQLAAHGLLRASFIPPEPIRELRDLTRTRSIPIRDRTLKSKIPALIEALTGRFKDHHAFMARLHLGQVDTQTRTIDTLTTRIEEAMEPFRTAREFLATIPGVSLRVAEVIIAETGADMSVFETPGRLASWAGVCPGSNESAGRIKSSHILPGNKYLKAALGTAALSASRSKNTYLSAKYGRIKARRDP